MYSFIQRTQTHRDVLVTLRDGLHRAILKSIIGYRHNHPNESIYAFALSVGQGGNALGWQLMTEETLAGLAEYHYQRGYRHRYTSEEDLKQLDCLRKWLRWQNPDDDWYMDGFEDPALFKMFQSLVVRQKAFGEDNEFLFEYFCDDVMATLNDNEEWLSLTGNESITLGVVADDTDFFTCCVRCNTYLKSARLWRDVFTGLELDRSISAQERRE